MEVNNRDKAILISASAGIAVVTLLILQTIVPASYFSIRTKIVTETSTATTSQTVTSIETSTVTPTQEATETVENTFTQHLLSFGSRNVSSIVAQYEPDGNVTWNGLPCLNGIFVINGDTGNFSENLDDFFGYLPIGTGPPAPHGAFIGNVTRTTTLETDGSVMVNSTFGLVAQTFNGNFTATIWAQD